MPILRENNAGIGSIGFNIASAVVARQVVKMTSTGIAPTSAILDVSVGVVEVSSTVVGSNVPVLSVRGQQTIVISDGAIAIGAELEPSTTAGRVKTFTTGTKCGIALTAAVGAGEQIEMKIY